MKMREFHFLSIEIKLTLTLYMLNFSEGTKTYIYILSFLHIYMTQVVEILPQARQELTYSTCSQYHGC